MHQLESTVRYDISIIIVSFNTKNMTQDCLNSIFLNSADLSVQVIVVDNNSQDGSVEMIKKEFPGVILIQNFENKGFAAANNQGFAHCHGENILLLNSDTLILDDVLHASIDFLVQNPEVGGMACRVLNSDYTLQRTCFGYPTLLRLMLFTLALDRLPVGFFDQYLLRSWQRNNEREVEVVTGCYLMIPKKVLEVVGGLDESFFFYGEETDWCRRAREAGWKLVFSPVGEIVHHGGGSSGTLRYQSDIMLTAATVRLHKKYGGKLNAIVAYLLLLLFNCSRAVIWSVVALFNKSYKNRAVHFFNVIRSYRVCWPTG